MEERGWERGTCGMKQAKILKQGQAWDWSRPEAQEQERCSGQTCFQKAREIKCRCVGGLSLESRTEWMTVLGKILGRLEERRKARCRKAGEKQGFSNEGKRL